MSKGIYEGMSCLAVRLLELDNYKGLGVGGKGLSQHCIYCHSSQCGCVGVESCSYSMCVIVDVLHVQEIVTASFNLAVTGHSSLIL